MGSCQKIEAEALIASLLFSEAVGAKRRKSELATVAGEVMKCLHAGPCPDLGVVTIVIHL